MKTFGMLGVIIGSMCFFVVVFLFVGSSDYRTDKTYGYIYSFIGAGGFLVLIGAILIGCAGIIEAIENNSPSIRKGNKSYLDELADQNKKTNNAL